jgi:hypothetical protein
LTQPKIIRPDHRICGGTVGRSAHSIPSLLFPSPTPPIHFHPSRPSRPSRPCPARYSPPFTPRSIPRISRTAPHPMPLLIAERGRMPTHELRAALHSPLGRKRLPMAPMSSLQTEPGLFRSGVQELAMAADGARRRFFLTPACPPAL